MPLMLQKVLVLTTLTFCRSKIKKEVKGMVREREGYRDNYEMLLEMFPNKIILTRQEVAKAFEIDPRTAAKRSRIGADNSIRIASLARLLSK